jgi:uncharacterized protein YggE
MTRRTTTTVVAALAALTVVALVFGAGDPAGAATTSTRRITVVGTGQVKGTPDVADVSIGVSARGQSAGEALSTANDRAAKVIAALKDAGVADDDVQTSGLSIQPVFDDEVVTAYEVSNTVDARLREIPKVGEVLDAAARVAGDEVRLHGISFTVDDDSELLSMARERAVKRARTQAEQLAAAAGVELGDVVSIDEGAVAIPYASRGVAEDAAASVPVEPGSQTLSLSATVVYEIR